MQEAGYKTRPVLLVCGGTPRRNRTGDPILTMEPPGTAVRTALSPGCGRPSGPKLWVLSAHFWDTLFARAKDAPNELIGQYRFPSTSSRRLVETWGVYGGDGG
jgi:hypothetical protein